MLSFIVENKLHVVAFLLFLAVVVGGYLTAKARGSKK